MKFGIPSLLLLVSGVSFGQQAPRPVFEKGPQFRNAATHDDLTKLHQRVQKGDPMSKLPAAEGADPSLASPPEDFIKNSDILCFNGLATFVPKKAILAAPVSVKDRMGMQEGARVVSWKDFLDANRGWISTIEVDRELAEGGKTFSEEVADGIAKSTRLVVATYQGGPISVLPPKAEESNTEPKPPSQ